MNLSPLYYFNLPFPGDPDPQVTRGIIVIFVGLVAFQWTRSLVHDWPEMPRKAKRVAQWLTSVLVVNGGLLVSAAQRDDPVRVGTMLLGVCFFGLAASLLARFRNDEATYPIYPHLYPSRLWSSRR